MKGVRALQMVVVKEGLAKGVKFVQIPECLFFINESA